MTADQNKAIALIIPLIVKNNAGKVAIALRNSGYSKKFIPASELEARMFQFYTANPDKFFEVMKTIPWNYGEIETNKPEIRDELIKLVSDNTGYEVSKDTWWPELIALLSKSVPVQQNRNISMANYRMGMYGILLVLAAIGIVLGLIYMFRS